MVDYNDYASSIENCLLWCSTSNYNYAGIANYG
jgi:hypothetical protein